MKRKDLKTQNITQLLVWIAIIVLIAYIGSFVFARLDLTSEKRYTLSEETKAMLENLNDDIYLKIYLAGDDLPPGFKRLRRATKEMLEEFRVYAGDYVEYELINPSANPDKEIRSEIYKELYQKGIEPIDLKEKSTEGKTSQKIVFPGAIMIHKGRELAINLLKNNKNTSAETNLNNSIQALEYELVNAIKKISVEKKPKIAFVEGHGELAEAEVVDISRELSEYYQVQRGIMGGKAGILDAFEAIVIAKPRRRFSEQDKYVIDQYIMNGGKVLWLVDGVNADIDSLYATRSAIVMANDFNLRDQLFKYGARINPDLVMDLRSAPIRVTTGAQGGQMKLFPWYYFPLIVSDNQHFITKYMNLIRCEYISTVDTVGTTPDIDRTVLLTSSDMARKAVVPFRMSLSEINRPPNESQFRDSNLPLAVLLEGKFESVYKNRLLPDSIDKSIFKEKSTETKMIVVGDGDLIRNDVTLKGEVMPVGYDRHSENLFAGNKEFILNSLNYLCGDQNILKLRLRELKLRLLDRNQAQKERLKWQLINTLIPIASILLLGLFVNFFRKRKYTRHKSKQ